MAICGVIPERNSSRTRSLISTLASIAMPSVSAMAAMPGSVSVACMIERMPIKRSRLHASAATETTPNIE